MYDVEKNVEWILDYIKKILLQLLYLRFYSLYVWTSFCLFYVMSFLLIQYMPKVVYLFPCLVYKPCITNQNSMKASVHFEQDPDLRIRLLK